MKNIISFTFILTLFFACGPEETLHKLRITDIVLTKFNDPNDLIKWDTIDGPDMYISVSLNGSTIFISDRIENENIFSAPVSFQLNSNIIFQQGKDEISLNAYDADLSTDQIMEENLTLQPGIIRKSPTSEFISCKSCIGEWRMTYEILD